jgi:hypothetical protein
MVERVLGVQTSVDVVVDSIAHRGAWIAASLAVISITMSLRRGTFVNRRELGTPASW